MSVVITIRSFPHSWLITGFVKRVNTTGGPSGRGSITSSPAYSRVCAKYSDLLDRAQVLKQKLLKQD
jgi:hypothetical protein